MAICVRYLHRPSGNEIEGNVAFLGFVELPRKDEAIITDSFIQYLTKSGIDMDPLCCEWGSDRNSSKDDKALPESQILHLLTAIVEI